MDSIITYDYNDDFEKVDKITIQKSNIPDAKLNITTAGVGLMNYLGKQHTIDLSNKTLNKAIFPLYKIHVKETKNNLIFSTGDTNPINEKFLPTVDFFSLEVDFLKLNKQINASLITQYLKNLKALKINGSLIKGNKIETKGTLNLINENINSLYQLVK